MDILKKNSWGLLIPLACAVILFSGIFAATTHANPGGFPPGAKTATATTTPAVMTPNTGTSTVVYDSYNINGTNEQTTGVVSDTDSASLLVQFQASSTASKLKIAFEFSQDNIDWYADGTSVLIASTTTGIINANVPNSITWTFASTSLGGGPVLANNSQSNAVFNVVTPTRYVRAVISDSGNNAMVWAQFVPKKQQP